MRNTLGFMFAGFISISAVATPSLQQKLDEQFRRYESARALLLQRLGDTSLPEDKRVVSREEWENQLRATGELAWTAADTQALRQLQREKILAARLNARKASVIDFDAARALPEQELVTWSKKFCSAFPKGGMLHIHPSGTLNRVTVENLLRKENPLIDFQSLIAEVTDLSSDAIVYPAEHAWLVERGEPKAFLSLEQENQKRYVDLCLLPPGNHPFERFEAVFSFVSNVFQTYGDVEEAYGDFAARAVAEGVSYVEFTTGISQKSFEVFTKIFDSIEKRTGLTIRINRSFSRRTSKEELRKTYDDLMAMPPNKWVVGIDLLASERKTPALDTAQEVYGNLLRAVEDGQSHLHRTMHAGEIGDPRNPRDAMIMGAERLGHGVALVRDPVAMEYAAHSPYGPVAVEVNLVSNIRLQAIGDLRSHPYLDYLRLGIPVSLSTDDEGMFETDINNECEQAIRQTDVTYAEMKEMARNSIRTSFAVETDKHKLQFRLENSLANFEREWVKGSQRPANKVRALSVRRAG